MNETAKVMVGQQIVLWVFFRNYAGIKVVVGIRTDGGEPEDLASAKVWDWARPGVVDALGPALRLAMPLTLFHDFQRNAVRVLSERLLRDLHTHPAAKNPIEAHLFFDRPLRPDYDPAKGEPATYPAWVTRHKEAQRWEG